MTNKLAWVAAALATAGLIGVATPADAALSPPKAKKYANCTALNKVYHHGVAKRGARDRVRGSTRPVTNFLVYTAAYNLNKAKLDRDKDGVACEKH